MGDANYNTVNVTGDAYITNLVGAGLSHYGNTNYNTLNINSGTIDGGTANGKNMGRGIYGGLSMGTGDANNNTVNISGGTIIGDVYGGWAPNGNANYNTINVYNNPDLTNANLYPGNAANEMIGNSLNFYTKDITAQNIYGFQDLNFILPETITDGDTILTLTNGSTDLSNTTVNINANGASNLHTGDTYTLLQNNNGITTSNVTNSGTISEGISLNYLLDIGTNPTSITATVGEQVGGLNYKTKIINQTAIANITLPMDSFDRIVSWLPPEGDDDDLDAVFMETENEYRPFFNTSYNYLRRKTGNGSYVRTKNGGMDVGFAKTVVSDSGNKLYFAPIFDYGTGNYDSYLSDGTHGHGQSNYWAGGVIFRKVNKGSGFYYEGSARLGRARSNFASNDFEMGGNPVHLSYSVSAPVYAGHVHIGQLYPINRENTFQLYGQYFHTYQGSMDTSLSTGEHYEFDSINSGRFRTGVRLIRQTPNKKNVFYSGLAYQYEFNGDASADYRDFSTNESSMKGSSGLLELGWQIKPSKASPIMLDLGAVGWIGYQEGITCHVKFKKAF